MDYKPPPPNKTNPKYAPKVDTVPLGSLITDTPIRMLDLISNTKKKFVVIVAVVLFVHTVTARDDGRYTIAVTRESNPKIILMKSCLAFGFF